MYAIIADGGRQYKVTEGQNLDVDYRTVEGEELTFDRVLAISGADGTTLGSPTIAGASVTAELVGPSLGKKLTVQKFRRRKNSRRKTGHRQMYTRVKISRITDPNAPTPPPTPEAAPTSETPESETPQADAPESTEGSDES